METCTNCGRSVGNLETPYLWNENVVCAGCYRTLAAMSSVTTPRDADATGDPLNDIAAAVASERSKPVPNRMTAIPYQGPTTAAPRIGALGIASLGVGTCSLFVTWIPFCGLVGWPLCIIGGGLAIIDLCQRNRNHTLAIAGLIVCAVSFASPLILPLVGPVIRVSKPTSVSAGAKSNPSFPSSPLGGGSESPGFDISLRTFGDYEIPCKSYVITNQQSSPLTIQQVTYNGEYNAPLGEETPPWIQTARKQYPVTLTIGERAYVILTLPGHFGVQRSDYPKSIIYIEVHTNRGVFKFDGLGYVQR